MSSHILYVADTRGFTPDAVFPLSAFNFHVTDAETGAPVSAALCVIHAGINGTGDGISVYTDSQGNAGMDAEWFSPRSWSVTKEGYRVFISNNMVTWAEVILTPIELRYSLIINSNLGGTTTPSGQIWRDPDTQIEVEAIPNPEYVLDHWVYKGENVGSVNPHIFLIDRNAITISAVFKSAINGGNGNGPPPVGVTKRITVFNKKRVKATRYQFKEVARKSILDVDTNLLVDARVEYVVKYTEGSVTNAGAFIELNGEEIVFESLKKGEAKDGIVNVTGLIQKTSNFTITVHSAIGNYEEVEYTVILILTFSEEPPVPPGIDDPNWFEENAWWLALAGGAVLLGGAALMLARPQIIVVGK